MTKYTYHHRMFDKNSEAIEIPDDATGLSVDYFGDMASVQYLTPTGDRCPECGSDQLESTGVGDECQLCGWNHHG